MPFIQISSKWSVPPKAQSRSQTEYWWETVFIIQMSLKREKKIVCAVAANRTRGPSMATMDFTTKPLKLGSYLRKGLSEYYILSTAYMRSRSTITRVCEFVAYKTIRRQHRHTAMELCQTVIWLCWWWQTDSCNFFSELTGKVGLSHLINENEEGPDILRLYRRCLYSIWVGSAYKV